MHDETFYITSESVTEGHPDKICDQISDAILDAHLAQDPYSRVAVECLVTTGSVHVAGEVTSKAKVDVQNVVRQTLKEIGYVNPEFGMDTDDAGVWVSIHGQSPDIAQGVNENPDLNKEQGAGDQGMMYGYASNETVELMPFPIVTANKLTRRMAEARKNGEIKNLGPDGKSQVSVRYVNGKPEKITAVVIAQQHTDKISEDELRKEVVDKVIKPICGDMIDNETKIYVNATGRFVVGGPEGDTGVTGRKIIVDTYGGVGRHGGGAFCIAGTSLVNTERGLVKIEECQKIGSRGLLVKTDIHPMPAGAWYNNGIKPTNILITKDGYNIEATTNHLFRIIDTEGNYNWKSAGDLRYGDYVAIQTKNRLFGNDTLPEFSYSYKNGTAEKRKKKYTFPNKLTKDYAYLLGLLIGDGLCTNQGDIRLCVCEPEMKEIVQNVYEKISGDNGRIYGHWAYLGGVELRAYLKHLGLDFAKSFEKTVPKSIFSASKENCAVFLKGLWDTDGCVRIDGRNKNSLRLHLATTSRILAEQVQILLLSFGIISKIQVVNVGKNVAGFIKGRQITSLHTRYDLVIKGSRSVIQFKEYIGFNLERKQKILESLLPEKRDALIIPYQKKRIISLFNKLPVHEKRIDNCKIGRFTRSSSGKATKELTYEKLKEFIDTYELFLKNEPDFKFLQQICLMDHYYTQIERKIPSFSETYDLNIPFSHTFTANGFVCHNSGKDPSKVDRSGAYMARHIAKNIVAGGVADRCEVQISYSIGVAKPTSFNIDTFGTGKIPDNKIVELVEKHFDLRPRAIIEYLNLRRPIFRKTAAYGHFGRNEEDFTWEKTNKAEELRRGAGL